MNDEGSRIILATDHLYPMGVDSDGTWSPNMKEPVAINGTTSSISLPAASAAVITYENGNNGDYLLPDQQVQLLIRQHLPQQTLPPQPSILPLQSRYRRRNIQEVLFLSGRWNAYSLPSYDPT